MTRRIRRLRLWLALHSNRITFGLWLCVLAIAVASMLYGVVMERREVKAGVWSNGTGGR
jgi:hypothetical protein